MYLCANKIFQTRNEGLTMKTTHKLNTTLRLIERRKMMTKARRAVGISVPWDGFPPGPPKPPPPPPLLPANRLKES